jgi:hypothetical protein
VLRKIIIPALGFAAGTVITYLVVLIGTTVVWSIFHVHDQDAGGAMAVAFFIGPILALFGGVAGGLLAYRMIRQR